MATQVVPEIVHWALSLRPDISRQLATAKVKVSFRLISWRFDGDIR
jgi:hypothetical protein